MAKQNQGHLKISRRMFTDSFWREHRVFSRAEAWLDLIQLAAWEPRKDLIAGKVVLVPRGAIAASHRFLSERWDWSRSRVERFMDLLASMDRVTIEHDASTGANILTLTNYSAYNDGRATGEASSEATGEATDKATDKATGEATGEPPKAPAAKASRKRAVAPAPEKLPAGVAEVWDCFLAQRELCYRELGKKMAPMLLSQERTEKILDFFRAGYTVEQLQDACRGMRFSDYHMGRGKYDVIRLTPEYVFHTTAKINQVELLSNLYRNPKAKPAPTGGTPHGTVTVAGTIWNAELGRPQSRQDFEAYEAAKAEKKGVAA